MKKKLIPLLLLLVGKASFSQNGVSAYYYYNPYMYSSVLPSYYPTIIGNNRINIITPVSCNLNDVKFPGLSITPANINSPTLMSISSYESYSNVTNTNPDLVKANHNYVLSQIEREILDESISKGCSGVAKITTEAAKKWLVGFCPVAETPPTAVACAIGTALQNAIVLKATQVIVKKGCKVTVTYISDELIQISYETYQDLERSVEEAKFWMGFLNSVDGMIWIMNRIQSNNPEQ
jgi:hypothetical protein